eukprot:3207501-Alexandrium_andersonii.AAC.1
MDAAAVRSLSRWQIRKAFQHPARECDAHIQHLTNKVEGSIPQDPAAACTKQLAQGEEPKRALRRAPGHLSREHHRP